MAIENWIDALARVWEISDGKGGTVKSYQIATKSEFPESLSTFPCALSYPTGLHPEYSAGMGSTDIWRGKTEFHLFPDTKKSNLGKVLSYFERIKAAAASNFSLGGLVSHFIIQQAGDGIQGPLTLQYGDEAEHHGLVVYWEVKERSSITVSG